MSTTEGAGRIVTDKLILYVDGANPNSYVSGSTKVNNLVLNESGNLDNGVTYNTNNLGYFGFDGTDDKISFGTRISSLNLSYPFTIDLWINLNATGNTVNFRGIFTSSTTSSLTNYYGVWIQLASAYNGSGNYKVGVGVGNGVSPGSTGRRSYTSDNEVLIGGTWCHLVGTIASGPTFKLYVNGVEVSGTLSGTGGALVWGPNTVTEIGTPPGGYNYFLNGSISNLKFYNKLLSQDEILNNFNVTRFRFGL
jgi:hypothetical protein